MLVEVAIPSNRVSHSGIFAAGKGTVRLGRNPLKSGQSFRHSSSRNRGGTCNRSQSPQIGSVIPAVGWPLRSLRRSVAIPSNRVSHSGTEEQVIENALTKSQSPQIGSVIPAIAAGRAIESFRMSQSPQIGSVIPAKADEIAATEKGSRNPLKSGQSFRRAWEAGPSFRGPVAIPSNRVSHSGLDLGGE